MRWPRRSPFDGAAAILLRVSSCPLSSFDDANRVEFLPALFDLNQRQRSRRRSLELNPNVVKIATTQFTFLRDCPAEHEVISGDARLSLEREASRHFDLLVVDAFSGDSIPVHLLTREAFRLYWRHLRPDGVLAVHVSNKYLSLGPVVALAAAENKKQAMLVSYDGNETNEESSSDWALVTSRSGFFELPEIVPAEKPIDPIPGLRMWTDSYSNLYRILR